MVEEEDNGSADANGTAGGAANGSATSGIAEAALIKAHRDQIHEMMDIVKAVRSPRTGSSFPQRRSHAVVLAQEMRLVGQRNKGEATQMAYMDRVDSLLSKKLALIMQLKAKLSRFREAMDM